MGVKMRGLLSGGDGGRFLGRLKSIGGKGW